MERIGEGPHKSLYIICKGSVLCKELFEKGSNGSPMQLVTFVENNGTIRYDMDYYLVEIVWDSDDFASFSKETDLVYIIVKALQLRPTEK